ncbi:MULTISPECIES: response regulator [unclassified Luteibacter]|uniref:response regulator n=1 Tax=unclassified Luteibacter TaxID=2620188 RepID=UPI0008D4E481|nr:MULTISPECIES: response regulator [unclassified Luteibacter]MDR6935040.1 two-component system capsular synthesis response regulator RcsB [Luteibacter sp. 3190]SEW00054.1 two component transcriptional regulator, LuxR family [Luteibacter sp. 329MFSha]
MSSSVIIADDHPVVVAGVETILRAHRYDVVARAHDTDTLFETLRDNPCDVVVTDYSMPEGSQPDGMPMIRRIRTVRPDAGIVVLTMLSNPAILRSLLDMGVAAIFDKRTNLRDIPVAVHAAEVGRSYLSPAIRRLFHEADCASGHDELATRLSPREIEVLRAYAQGHGQAAIAEMMGRSFKTISRQKRSAMAKLGLVNDAQLYQFLAGVRAASLDDWSPAIEAAAKRIVPGGGVRRRAAPTPPARKPRARRRPSRDPAA